jgi:hypothetical protein
MHSGGGTGGTPNPASAGADLSWEVLAEKARHLEAELARKKKENKNSKLSKGENSFLHEFNRLSSQVNISENDISDLNQAYREGGVAKSEEMAAAQKKLNEDVASPMQTQKQKNEKFNERTADVVAGKEQVTGQSQDYKTSHAKKFAQRFDGALAIIVMLYLMNKKDPVVDYFNKIKDKLNDPNCQPPYQEFANKNIRVAGVAQDDSGLMTVTYQKNGKNVSADDPDVKRLRELMQRDFAREAGVIMNDRSRPNDTTPIRTAAAAGDPNTIGVALPASSLSSGGSGGTPSAALSSPGPGGTPP